MKILVTGGAGYIGSILVPKLLQKGHEVCVFDNFMYQQTPLLDVCSQKNLQIVRGDVRDEKLLKQLCTKQDVILPLACLTGVPACNRDPQGALQINQEAVINIGKWKSKDQALVYPCTNSGYGVGQDGVFCDENTPLNPISLYGKVKVAAESFLLNSGEAVTFRLATVFGISPRMRLDLLVNDFVFRAVNDKSVVLFEPHFKRNYLHVQDAADAFVFAIENYTKMKGKPFNVGLSEANLSKEELCQAIQKVVKDFKYVISHIGEDPDKRNYVISNARIEALGFKTKVSLTDGIEELVRGFNVIRKYDHTNQI